MENTGTESKETLFCAQGLLPVQGLTGEKEKNPVFLELDPWRTGGEQREEIGTSSPRGKLEQPILASQGWNESPGGGDWTCCSGDEYWHF